MIKAQNLTKRYGDKTVVDDLSFTAQPGIITGFLGPNGAGKSTTMRMIMGLDSPSSGSVTVNGKPFSQHSKPLHEVGALLDAKAVHSGRTARNHLLAMAATNGISTPRVDEIIDAVGLQTVAKRRAGKFSLGMGQRLGIAAALLGDPETLILDEPVNGLDPDGIRWIRTFLKDFAAQGRTVLLSSHLMSEMALTADRVVVIGRGRLLRDQTMAEFIADASTNTVFVRSPQAKQFRELLINMKIEATSTGRDQLHVDGLTSQQIGTLAAQSGFTLYELTPQAASLEDAYMAITEESIDYKAAAKKEKAQ